MKPKITTENHRKTQKKSKETKKEGGWASVDKITRDCI